LRFSKLRLTGFKSFVDPTDLLIQDGLTGVVGPNGCGKSNLLEALRWVMGENRPTAMRGGGMEDVIFAGAASRPARNFAEVTLQIDNAERLAPAGFNDQDHLEIVRRITRDVGSAYKANGKDTRARDVQMLFADASTGAHSPALVRQGQISELINAKPKNRRRILEEAAGISGLYARRHEAELKLNGAEQNLTRVDDVVENLASQLATLERQAKQAARYRAIGTELRQAEGMLLYRRWREADEARTKALAALREKTSAAAQAETAARAAARAREEADEALPPKREEEAIASAILQRLTVERDALADREKRALDLIGTLKARIAQLMRDMDRESGLNRDAGETIATLEAEAEALAEAGEGHDAALEEAAEAAREAAAVLREREEELAELTEDVARLAARHQSAHRFLEDSRKTLNRSEEEAGKARAAVAEARKLLSGADAAQAKAQEEEEIAAATAERAEETLLAAETARAETQSREADARAETLGGRGRGERAPGRGDGAGEAGAAGHREGGQVMDLVKVRAGYEKALGAALADDLRAPVVDADGPSAGRCCRATARGRNCPPGAGACELRDGARGAAPPDLADRRGRGEDGARLQAQLKPGQRLVTVEGDLWRWTATGPGPRTCRPRRRCGCSS
jgi:chromosome segregation protein